MLHYSRILFLLFFLAVTSCDKVDEPSDNTIIDTAVELAVKNEDGEDILDPSHPDAIDVEALRLFYKVDGEVQEVYDGNLSSPRNISHIEHQNEYRLRISLNYTESEEKPVTYLEWNENDTDTLEAVFRYPKNGVIQEEVWYNGDSIWNDSEVNTEPYLELTR
ncbi:hypothetical protein FKX85_03370 [Echinicola soli]|uniref:Lipoprotein n=1 Tax=Echinicola soli TaxID=2591634 RepID=A0A514CE85_9BACT|nr:hypothetical protein [Echinicola soli]QDH78127.1 hypothetical protein FKX85_03370 [Echinicola soli]